MKLHLFHFFLFISILSTSCTNDYSTSGGNTDDEESVYDGEYCADVEYYNPNTGTRNTYSLNVIVSDNELVEIQFPNGGWMDDDHFSPEELDDNGYCSITSDKGYEYSILITGDPCSYTDDQQVLNDYEDEQENYTCPNCGEKKYEYDEYCMNCEYQRQQEEEEENEETKEGEEY